MLSPTTYNVDEGATFNLTITITPPVGTVKDVLSVTILDFPLMDIDWTQAGSTVLLSGETPECFARTLKYLDADRQYQSIQGPPSFAALPASFMAVYEYIAPSSATTNATVSVQYTYINPGILPDISDDTTVTITETMTLVVRNAWWVYNDKLTTAVAQGQA